MKRLLDAELVRQYLESEIHRIMDLQWRDRPEHVQSTLRDVLDEIASGRLDAPPPSSGVVGGHLSVDEQVPMWDAINEYVLACNGDPVGNISVGRMKAVVKVNEAVTKIKQAALNTRQPSPGGWWCPTCKAEKDPKQVTFTEHCETCGTFICDKSRPEIGGWLDMETAPMSDDENQQPVLILQSGRRFIAEWDASAGYYQGLHAIDGVERTLYYQEWPGRLYFPAGWQPIPALPQPKAEGENE